MTESILPKNLKRGHAFKHGHAGRNCSLTYSSWGAMKERCDNPNHIEFFRWGGRGIKICDRWRNFENFLKDMGERPSKEMSLDRIDNDGNYEPSNCRWATKKQQIENRRVRKDVFKGKNCKQCGNFFTSKRKRQDAIYCSHKCHGESQRKRVKITCQRCSKQIEVQIYEGNTRKYCNRKCRFPNLVSNE